MTSTTTSNSLQGLTFKEALSEAQRMGIAEADPSGDIDGFDASVKVAALVRALSGAEVGLEQVETQVRWVGKK